MNPVSVSGGPVGYEVTDLEMLKVVDNDIRARTVGGKQQSVDPGRGVPAAATPAHLDQPRPHRGRRGIDADRVVRDDDRSSNDLVTRQRHLAFFRCRAVGHSQPDHSKFCDRRGTCQCSNGRGASTLHRSGAITGRSARTGATMSCLDRRVLGRTRRDPHRRLARSTARVGTASLDLPRRALMPQRGQWSPA